MSNEGANIVYGASAALAVLTAGALDAHNRGMEAVRAAREERELDQWHAYYEGQLADRASLMAQKDAEIAALREELARQSLAASTMKGLWQEAKQAIARKDALLAKVGSALQTL